MSLSPEDTKELKTEKNVKEMSDEEKEAALEELRKGLEIAPEDDLEKTEEKSEE